MVEVDDDGDGTVDRTLTVGNAVPNEAAPEAPAGFGIGLPTLNPSRTRAAVAITVPMSGPVRLALYDALGREVTVVLDEARSAGAHEVELPVGPLPPGVYVVRLTAGREAATRTVSVLR